MTPHQCVWLLADVHLSSQTGFFLSSVTQNRENGVPALPVSDDNHHNYLHEHTVFTLENQHNGIDLPVILLAVLGY